MNALRSHSSSKITLPLLCLTFIVGLQLTPLASFAQYTKLLDFGSTANGANPYSTPVSVGTFLYGMTLNGGTNDLGTIYKIKNDGTGFTKMIDFDGTNGSNPSGSLYYDGTFLYGMTTHGATDDHGVIFRLLPDGTGYTILTDFAGTSNGAFPSGSLIKVGGSLYGMATAGGSIGYGVIFKILPDGTGFTNLFNFDYTTSGGYPYGSLFSDGTTFLYGMTTLDGSSDFGTIFKIKNDGTGYVKLHNFSLATGSVPKGDLISDGTFLYGMTNRGGSAPSGGDGVIFKIMPDGSNFSKIVDFDYSAIKGAYPTGSLVYDGTFLYGTTSQNSSGQGTIFKVKTDGSVFTKILDHDINVNGAAPEGTLLWDGASTFYGVRSGLSTSFSGLGYLGTIYKINNDGSGYTKLLNYEATGNSPVGSLALSGATLYGMTGAGGQYNYGTIIKTNTDGSGFAKVLDFDGATNGRSPAGRPFFDGTFLYGMTSAGGANDAGTIFKVKPDGSGYVSLLDFDATNNGNEPNGSLISDGTFLYGMTSHGGANGFGTIFKIKPDGSVYTKLNDFDDTNGSYPNGSLMGVGGVLYGMTSSGGTNGGWGTIFRVNTDGSAFSKLLDFDYDNTGANPNSSLTYDGTFFYGMTSSGGINSYGTLFKIKPDGTGYAKLLDFDYTNNGSNPNGSLFSDGSFLYGMTSNGGVAGAGTVFKIKFDGTSYIKLLDFNDGSNPQGALISDGTFLYGMTQDGGAYSLGTLFKITKTPFVSISDFTPGDGGVGTLVTIDGTNFDPVAANNIVKFNNTTAVVKSSTATTIVAVVPIGATSGPISVTATTTGTSVPDFTVTTNPEMFNGSVQSCNSQFSPPSDNYIQANNYNPVVETFIPVNPTDKVKVSFSTFQVPDDVVNVYDGPDTSSPLIISLNGNSLPADIVATGPGGELTFEYDWGDGSSPNWLATISCQSPGPTISISAQPSDFTACAGDVATFTTSASGTTSITYQWQYSSDGIAAFTDLTNAGGYSNVTTATLSVATAGGFGAGRYRCKIDGDLATTVFTNDEGLFINTTPAAPSVSNISNCGPGSLTLTASGSSNGNYLWYDNNGLISGQTNGTYATPVISTTTIYSVAITNGTCTGAKVNITATINTIPSPPLTQGLTACTGSTFTLTASGGIDGQYVWYTNATGGSAIPGEVNSTYFTPALTGNTTYYVSINDGICESARKAVTATVISSGCSIPIITAAPLTTQIGGSISLDVVPLITTSNNNLDLSSITVTIQPLSGAIASVTNGVLTVNYSGISFSGTEQLTLRACDTDGNCTTQVFNITVAGDIVVYNGISPNGKNPAFIIEYIDLLQDTKNNTVAIFDRWENQVWHGTNYDNSAVVFTGVSDGGSDLPSGVYYYKINFSSGRKTQTGFLSLRRQ